MELSYFQTQMVCLRSKTRLDALQKTGHGFGATLGAKFMIRAYLRHFQPIRISAAFALTLMVSVGISATSLDHAHELCKGFVPENDMRIPVGWSGGLNSGGLSEAEFHDVLDRIERLFAPEISKHGGTLRVNRKWSDPTVNASAQQFGRTWILNMYGGLARHPEITVEGFALVACHELGHHIGGAPKINGWFGVDWATNEGGADYFATLKCLRTFFAEDDNASILADATLDPLAEELCAQQFTHNEDRLLCLRNSVAAASVAGLFMQLRKETVRPRFDTPDDSAVRETDDTHPGTQCRMDTYFNGAICHVDVSVPVSQTDYRQGSCIDPNDTLGLRPRCWFKPDSNQLELDL